MIERIQTIGVYGFDPGSFMAALQAAGVDLFVDIRARRGVRGAEYSFANAGRLTAALEAADIRYIHVKDLAPAAETRGVQYAADAATKEKKRDRTRLSPEFIAAYERQCLSGFSPAAFAAEHLAGAQRPVLFCVEREPGACHRSLVAERLGTSLGVPIEHLMPTAGKP